MKEPFLFHSSLPGLLVSSHFFFFPLFHPSWLHGDLSCDFGFMRSSASIQQLFCENCSHMQMYF